MDVLCDLKSLSQCSENPAYRRHLISVKIKKKKCQVFYVRCLVQGVLPYMTYGSGDMLPVICHLSPVTNTNSPATDPSPANSPTIQSWLVCQERSQKSHKKGIVYDSPELPRFWQMKGHSWYSLVPHTFFFSNLDNVSSG